MRNAYSYWGWVTTVALGIAACSVEPNDPIPDFGDANDTNAGTGEASEPDTATGEAEGSDGGDTTGDDGVDASGDGANPDCGDGIIGEGEQCEGGDLADMSCESLGFDPGTLTCSNDCQFDTSACGGDGPACGDGSTDGTEDCDGADLGGSTCTSMGFDDGTLGCNADCTFDTTGCTNDTPNCGNGTLDPGEDCDGVDLGGQTCLSQGFLGGGVLVCDASCNLDTAGCMADGGGGGPCTFDADCGGTQYCEAGTCYDGVTGDPCTFDSDCMSDICLTFDDYCSEGNAGDPCTFNSECQSGSCGVADVCD